MNTGKIIEHENNNHESNRNDANPTSDLKDDDLSKVPSRTSTAPMVLESPEILLEAEDDRKRNTVMGRFKAFWQAYWKKILACAGIGAVLVVAGVFTGGIVPLIAGAFGLGIGVAAAVGLGGAAVVGGLAGAGVGAITSGKHNEEPGVGSFFQRHKWKIIIGGAAALFIVGCVLTGGILAAFGIVAAGGAVGAGLAFCASVATGAAGGVAATTTAITGVAVSATAATAVSTSVVATGAITVGCSTGCIIGAIKDNKKDKKSHMTQDENPEQHNSTWKDRLSGVPLIGRLFAKKSAELMPGRTASGNNVYLGF